MRVPDPSAFEREVKELFRKHLEKEAVRSYDEGRDAGYDEGSSEPCGCDLNYAEKVGKEKGYDEAIDELVEILETLKDKDFEHAAVLCQRLGLIYTAKDFK